VSKPSTWSDLPPLITSPAHFTHIFPLFRAHLMQSTYLSSPSFVLHLHCAAFQALSPSRWLHERRRLRRFLRMRVSSTLLNLHHFSIVNASDGFVCTPASDMVLHYLSESRSLLSPAVSDASNRENEVCSFFSIMTNLMAYWTFTFSVARIRSVLIRNSRWITTNIS
jgi:hypothetical protein